MTKQTRALLEGLIIIVCYVAFVIAIWPLSNTRYVVALASVALASFLLDRKRNS